ncbi:MAG: hypothetical protein WB699_17720 [Bacteroidota bacterium]
MSLSCRLDPALRRNILSFVGLIGVLIVFAPSSGRSGVLWTQLHIDSSRAVFPSSLSFARVEPVDGESGLFPVSLVTLQDTPVVEHHEPRLLPPSLSPVEKIIWGESGFLRTTGIAPLTPSARMSELRFRRTMLTIHQIGGFVTLGLLVPTIIYGQRNIQNWNDAMMGVRPLDRQLNRTHRMWADLAFTSYLVTAAMAILSPPPIIRRNEASTITTHKILAWVHFTGMIALPILGALAAHANTADQAKTLRTVHAITAYTTAAALATAMIVITF